MSAQEEDTVSAGADVALLGHEFEYAFNMRLRYNYRLYPAPGQRIALARAFGCARVVFNDALRAREAACQAGERYLTDAQLSARRQRELSRKQQGSANRAKARVKVARAHARVADARRDFHHQLSTALIRDNQAVAVEDLAVQGLARTRLAKSVHDASAPGAFVFTDSIPFSADCLRS
jgi:transposase